MRIPKKLKIGGHQFKVIVKEFDDCGKTKRTTNEMWIASDLTQSQKESTLFHEILHALNNELAHPLLDSLAEQLYQVLSDNKLLK